MVTISDLLGSSSALVRNLVAKAHQYGAELVAGTITQAEYDTLIAQLTDLRVLYAQASGEEERQQVAVAVQFIAGAVL